VFFFFFVVSGTLYAVARGAGKGRRLLPRGKDWCFAKKSVTRVLSINAVDGPMRCSVTSPPSRLRTAGATCEAVRDGAATDGGGWDPATLAAADMGGRRPPASLLPTTASRVSAPSMPHNQHRQTASKFEPTTLDLPPSQAAH